ncbi:tetratricopeptide repeat protein [Lysobacter sp. K5869]|uniref:tetratricopeptide repeat protein n=1 Tax=Lysobacter sp. K5869 TaxID=2820808 RepID=UPI001C05F4A1|nr:tetratricopeptide repeat protein [Lysobacter sp. K5869]QWP76101.1 tetratricopeptide repeat protein [Lysobacter sp. K5869]
MSIEEIKGLLEAGEIDRARALLIALTDSDPDEARAWLLLAGISTRTQDWTLGETAFTALTRLRPSDALASSGLVASLVGLHHYDRAREEIARFGRVADRSKSSSSSVLQEHQEVLKRIGRGA